MNKIKSANTYGKKAAKLRKKREINAKINMERRDNGNNGTSTRIRARL